MYIYIHIFKKISCTSPKPDFFFRILLAYHIHIHTRICYIYIYAYSNTCLKNVSSNNHLCGPKNSMETQPLTAGAERFCCGPRRPTVVQKFQGRGGWGLELQWSTTHGFFWRKNSSRLGDFNGKHHRSSNDKLGDTTEDDTTFCLFTTWTGNGLKKTEDGTLLDDPFCL